MSLVALTNNVTPVTQIENIVTCNSRPLSEHIWCYFEFSYDKYFTAPEEWKPRVNSGAFDYASFPGQRNSKRFRVIGLTAPISIVTPHETFSGITNGNIVSFDNKGVVERVDTAAFDSLIIPDQGIVDVSVSENGVNYASWQQNLDISSEGYSRLYKVAGLVTHVKAEITTAIIQTVPTPPKPGDPIYMKMIIARV